MIREIRRGWALAGPRERRRLTLVSAYGILVAILDTIALLLLFVMINVVLDQPVSGLTEKLLPEDYADDRYRTALVLLIIAAGLFAARSLLSVLGLWLTIGAANAAQVELLSRLLVGHARASHLTRLERSPSETLRTLLIEGMAAKVAIVAADAGGPSEIIEHGVAGLLYRPRDVDALADALSFLAAHPERRRELAEAGLRRSHDFSPSVVGPRYVEVYKYLLRAHTVWPAMS